MYPLVAPEMTVAAAETLFFLLTTVLAAFGWLAAGP
jgi:hypothetical protein